MSGAAHEAQKASLIERVEEIVMTTQVYDIHTHLYDPAFGSLLLWGIDDLLGYHYLIAEVFRYLDMPYEKFWELSKSQQADLIWDQLFIRHSPISEACQGVLTTLRLLGLDAKRRDLPLIRRWFAEWRVNDYLRLCMNLANVKTICMTNSPFDDLERPVWEKGFDRDESFKAALRIDPMILAWETATPQLSKWGYAVTPTLTARTQREARRFLSDWSKRIDAKYLMVSLPPDFDFPAKTLSAQIIEKIVLPHCREHGLPFALMLGVRRGVNPQLRLAGDGVGRSKIEALENLCASFPENKFLATVLARENQQELCVAARKFRNLHIFGCWWFNNIPYLIDEMTRMRIELVGLSLTAQQSDARVLDQLIYKWDHTRRIIAKVLAEKYLGLIDNGWEVTEAEIQRDVYDLLGGAFERFCAN